MGAYGLQDPTYQALSNEDDPKTALSKILSPMSAAEIVGPPPDSPPPGQPGVSTQRTGNLAAAPRQAVAKNLDTAEGRGAYNTSSNVQPAQPQPASPIGGLSRPSLARPSLASGASTLAPLQASRMQSYQASPAGQAALAPAPAMPSGVGSSPIGGLQPATPAFNGALVKPDRLNMQTLTDQQKLQAMQAKPAGGAQISNRFGRVAAGIGDVALSVLAPNVAQYVPGTTLNKARQVGVQQGVVNSDQAQQTSVANQADIASQTQERTALGKKAEAVAAADAPFNPTPEQAAGVGHPEIANLPMVQRTYAAMLAAKQRADAQIQVGAGHDTTKVTTTGMNNDTSKANNEASNTSRETVAQARDKTQRLLGELRANVSTANNERTNASKTGGGKPDQTGHYKVPADVTKKAGLADNVKENADAMEAIIARRPELVGKIGGSITSIEQMAGDNDGDIQELAQRAHNIALASNGAHGVRNVHDTAKTEDNILRGFRNGPAGVHGALQGLRGSVQTFLEDEKNFRQTGGRVAPTAPTGGAARDPNMLYARDPNGKLHVAPKAGAKPLPPGWKFDTGGK